ncbi:MAG TPA: formyltransferase family protein [Polyangiaceae bacterium]
MPLRIAYFGLPLAACLLHADGHDVRVAVLPPVFGPGRRRLGRSIGGERILRATVLGDALDRSVEAAIAREKPELLVSWFWTRRIPARVLERVPLGGIGAHPSLLPRHRGPDPYFWAIDAGDATTGVTIHRLTERYDDGAILDSSALSIGSMNAWQLARALDRPSLALLRKTVRAFSEGERPAGKAQDETLATAAPEPGDDDLRVDFGWPTERALRRIRALAPLPGLALDIEGLELVVTRARRADDFPLALEPGEAAVVGDPAHVVLRTGDGAFAVERAVLELESGETALSEAETGAVVRRYLTERRARELV